MMKDFHKFCRFCLGSNCELLDISTTEESESNMSVTDMVDYIMGKECLQDAFAKKACIACLKAMEQTCEFKAMCEQSLDYVYNHLRKELGMTEPELEMETEIIPEIEQVVIDDNYTLVDQENDDCSLSNPLEISPDDAFISNEKQIENIQKTATRKRKQQLAILKDADVEKVVKEKKLVVKLTRIDDYILKQLKQKKLTDANTYLPPPKLKLTKKQRVPKIPVESPQQIIAYQCFECGKIMKSESFFEKHLGIHPNVQQCTECQKFKTNKKFGAADNKYICRCPGQKGKIMFTITPSEIRIVMQDNRDRRLPYCRICRKIVKNIEMLERHKQLHENPEYKGQFPGVTVECPVCKKKSSYVQDFMDDLRSHSAQRNSV